MFTKTAKRSPFTTKQVGRGATSSNRLIWTRISRSGWMGRSKYELLLQGPSTHPTGIPHAQANHPDVLALDHIGRTSTTVQATLPTGIVRTSRAGNFHSAVRPKPTPKMATSSFRPPYPEFDNKIHAFPVDFVSLETLIRQSARAKRKRFMEDRRGGGGHPR